MMRFHHWALATAALSTALLGGDSRAATIRDLGVSPLGFQVAIGAATAEAYKSVAGMGLDMEAVRDPNTRPPTYRAGKKAWSQVKLVQVVGSLTSNTFDTDLGRDVTKIAFEPTTIDVILTANADPKLPPRSIPGPSKIGKVTFTLTSSASVADWGRAFVAGTATARDITINLRSVRGEVQRTMILKRALLVSYACDGAAAQIVVQPDALQTSGAANKVLIDWVQAGLDGSTNGRRDAKVTWNGTTTRGTTTLKSAFPVEIAWGTLDGTSAAQLVDTVTIQPDSIDPLP